MKSRTTRDFDDFIRRDLEREIAHHERLQAKKQQQAQKPPAPQPSAHFLSQVPDKSLTWLWPGRIPLGHLTLLDAAPGSGLSLFALALAASVSSGAPLPDGTPTQQGNVLLLTPYDSPTDIIKPRLQAAGGDLEHIVLISPLVQDASLALASSRTYTFPHDLDHLADLIRRQNARLVIIDPASAIPGLSRSLPALVALARQTTCAILLTRSLRQAPLNPLHATGPASPLLQAARARLLLAPDPSGDGQQLLLTTKHPLCTEPGILAYSITATEVGVPTIHWLGERDRDQLSRLSTGPLRSPYRQAILHFLRDRDAPQRIPDILKATSYDYEAGRRMLVHMKEAKELVSPARGLYTTACHPCLLHFSEPSSPVPNVANVTNVSTVPSSPHAKPANPLSEDVATIPNVASVASPGAPPVHSAESEAPPAPAMPVPDLPASMLSPVSSVANVASVASLSPPPASPAQSEAPPAPAMPVTDPPDSMLSPVSHVANVASVASPSAPPAHSAQHNRLSVSNVANVPYVSNPSHRENGIGIGGDKEEW